MDHHWTIPSETYRPSKGALEETEHRDRVLENNEDPRLEGKIELYMCRYIYDHLIIRM